MAILYTLLQFGKRFHSKRKFENVEPSTAAKGHESGKPRQKVAEEAEKPFGNGARMIAKYSYPKR